MSALNHSTAPLEVIRLDVPAGPIEPPPDRYHVLELHASGPVRASIHLDGRKTRGAQLFGDINCVHRVLGISPRQITAIYR
jgi:hypothetical protein